LGLERGHGHLAVCREAATEVAYHHTQPTWLGSGLGLGYELGLGLERGLGLGLG